MVARLRCWLRRQHEYLWQVDRRHVYLRCAACGKVTAGWRV